MGLSTVTRRLFGVGAASLLATPSRANPLLGVTHGPRSSTTGGGGGGPVQPPSTALFHFDGTNGSTSMPDSSGNGHVWTINGTVTIATAQHKFGTASAVFNGTSWLSNSDSPINALPGDFTIDFWMQWNGAQSGIHFFTWTSNSELYTVGSVIHVYVGADVIVGTTSITPNVWHHVAYTRASTANKLFLDGNQEGSTWTDSRNYVSGSVYLGGRPSSSPMNGWIDEFRLINGTAVWTANFTPPTAPYTQ